MEKIAPPLGQVSVVIEWENVLLAEMDRCRRMLRELRRQILEINASNPAPTQFEIIVVFNQEVVQPPVVTNELNQIFQTSDANIAWRLSPATGLNYYDLKNFGALETHGDIVLFLDSDVIPEAGWLKQLLGSLDNQAVEVVAGNTFLDLSSFMGRAMALSWLFPLRANESELKEVPWFFANNVAFRKATAAKFPFPKMQPGATRGSCCQLAENLRGMGIKIYQHSGAQVSHPPPNGWHHFFIRGVAQGRDELLLRRIYRGQSWFGREGYREFRRSFSKMFSGLGSIFKQRQEVNLSLGEVPLALSIVLIYWHCRLFGCWGTQMFPKFMGNHFRI
jgi:glycosyltransferase involved in cell wall biosynthesis